MLNLLLNHKNTSLHSSNEPNKLAMAMPSRQHHNISIAINIIIRPHRMLQMSHVAWFVSMLDTPASCAKSAETIELPFGG